MKLPGIENLDLTQKKALVRADLDLSVDRQVFTDINRLEFLVPTLEYLNKRNCEIILLGHRGKPEGKFNQDLSLKPVSQALEELLKQKWGEDKVKTLKMQMMENLRFNQGEEENDQKFAQCLAEKGDVYINEAFAVSHREHASIVGIPKFLPHAAGFRFRAEIENLSKVLDNPKRPLIFIISGLKEDKLDYLEDFSRLGDKVLIAGRLPEYIEKNSKLKTLPAQAGLNSKLIVATLLPDNEDVTIHTIEKFEEEIGGAGTIILAGPIGKFEEEGHRMGTERIFRAVAESNAFKVAGGGDTEKAISALNLVKEFNWISVGGGAMLQFLAKGTLPGIEALLN